jgi:GNAT superfamily N-acetyltransferase
MTTSIPKTEYKDIKRWYLEMSREPVHMKLVLPDNWQIRQFHGDCEEYRILNNLVGGDLGWVDRQLMNDKDLSQIIIHPQVKIYVLYSSGELAGFVELDSRTEGKVYMEYFGLVPDYRGKGLGKVFLDWAIAEAWHSKPFKFLLNTCEIDDPKALPLYLKAGFKIMAERIEKQAMIV